MLRIQLGERILVTGNERKDSWRKYFDELCNAGRQEEENVNMIVLEV